MIDCEHCLSARVKEVFIDGLLNAQAMNARLPNAVRPMLRSDEESSPPAAAPIHIKAKLDQRARMAKMR
jgi:hypothetical protein